MAYVVNSTNTPVSAAGTAFTVALGAHQTNDLLLAFVVQNGGTGTISAPGGWTIIGTQAAGGSVRSVFAYKLAASSSETNPQFTSSLSAEWSGGALVVRDADTGTLFDGTAVRVDTASATTLVSGAITTSYDGSLVITGWGVDSGSTWRGLLCKMNDATCSLKQTSAAVSHAVVARQQESAGASVAITGYLNSATGGQSWTIAVKNAASGALQPDIRAATTELRWYANYGGAHDTTVTWQAPGTIGLTTAGAFAIGTQYGIQTVGTTDFTLIGAASNAVGVVFTATGAGSGTGTASPTIGGIALQAGVSHASTGMFDSSPYNYWSGLTSLDTYQCWAGATHTIASTDFTGKIASIDWMRSQDSTSVYNGTAGNVVYFSDGTNWAMFQVAATAFGWGANVPATAFFAPATATPLYSSGTLNWATITRVGYFYHRAATGSTAHTLYVRNLMLHNTTSVIGGGVNRPATFVDLHTAYTNWLGGTWLRKQGSAQILAHHSVRVGNGTDSTYFDASASSLEYPPTWSATQVPTWQMNWNVGTDTITSGIKAKATDTVKLAASVVAATTRQLFAIDAASSTSATYSFSGLSLVGFTPTLKTGVAVTGTTFSRCGEIAAGGANLTDCTVIATVSTDAAIAFDTAGATMSNCTINVTGTAATYHLELGPTVTDIALASVTFTGTPATNKVHVRKTSGTVTITISGTTTLTAGNVTSDGATVSIVAPSLGRGLAFTGLAAGSKVKVFATGTDTELFSTASSGTTETWDDATAGSITVDYVVLQASYVPVRVTGVVCTGAVGTGVVTTPIQQVVDRAYVAASGLTINTNCFATTATKKLGLTVASTAQNFYSYLIEQWVALGDTGEAYANKQFPMAANGTSSFTCLAGWEFDLATYPNSITSLSRDGMRYLSAASVLTATWAAVLSVGVPAGALVRYQQSDGGTTVNANATGDIDQLIQTYGDATHGNFDKRSYLVCKVQEQGYDQAEVDVYTQYGTVEDYLYVIALVPLTNGVATGNPGISGVTITDHGASPVTWNSKVFSLTITDSAANSGTDILRWLRYAFDAGGAFQGTDAFNWHDLMQVNGDKFRGVRGKVYGDVGAALKGVRVLRGAAAHPDVTLHTADDGTTVSTSPPAAVNATVLANTRVVLYNVTQATEIDNAFVTGTTYSYTITTEAISGDILALYYFRLGYLEGVSTLAWAGAATNFVVAQAVDPVEAALVSALGYDGSSVTEFAPDTTGHIYIEFNDPDGATLKARLALYYKYLLTTTGGARYFRGGLSLLSDAAFRVNTAIVDILMENVNATTAVHFTDLSRRLYRDNGTTIIAPTSYSLHNDYSGVPDVVETGTSGLTGSESAQLMGLPSGAANAAAVLAAAQATPIKADVQEMNTAEVIGDGTAGNPWRGVGVSP